MHARDRHYQRAAWTRTTLSHPIGVSDSDTCLDSSAGSAKAALLSLANRFGDPDSGVSNRIAFTAAGLVKYPADRFLEQVDEPFGLNNIYFFQYVNMVYTYNR